MSSDDNIKSPSIYYGLHNIKKFELHMHLQGAITIKVFQSLYIKNKEEVYKYIFSDEKRKKRFLTTPNIARFMDKDAVDRKVIKELLVYRNILDFFATFRFINLFIKTIQDLDMVIKGVIDELIKQNIVYADILVSLPELLDQGFTIQEIMNELGKYGVNDNIKVNWWLDMVRSKDKNKTIELLDKVIKNNTNQTVFGIHIGGNEMVCDIKTYKEVVKIARTNGLQVEVHDGETIEVNSMNWYKKVKIGRITHGVSYLNRKDKIKIPIEVCLSSNKCTSLIANVDNHPIMQSAEHIKKICICTDDPTLFQTNLVNELMYIYKKYHLWGLKKVMENSIKYSYLTQDRKREFYEIFDKEWKKYFE